MIKRRKPIARVSERQKERLKEYAKVKRAILRKPVVCMVSNCYNRATDIHHMRGRAGSLLTDKRFLLPVCRGCHMDIHDDPAWARKHGYIEAWGKTTP